jgi:hypothetical protein
MGEEKVGIKPETLGEGGKGVEEQEVGGRGVLCVLGAIILSSTVARG